MCLFLHRCVETLAATQTQTTVTAQATSTATYRRLFADLSWLASRALSAPSPVPARGAGRGVASCLYGIFSRLPGRGRGVSVCRCRVGQVRGKLRGHDGRASTAFSLVRLHLQSALSNVYTVSAGPSSLVSEGRVKRMGKQNQWLWKRQMFILEKKELSTKFYRRHNSIT